MNLQAPHPFMLSGVKSRGRHQRRAAQICAATALIVVGCAQGVPPPRAPGSVAVARFGPNEAATRFRILTEQTRGLDEPPAVAVAETAGELRGLWHEYELAGAPPQVDFDQDLVLAFTEQGYCNDGRLEGFALTSAAEVLPRVRRTKQLCAGGHGDCPSVRVYVAALGRGAFPPGGYRFRWEGTHTFAVRSSGRAPAPLPPPPPPVTPPPPPEAGAAAARHARQARIVSGGDGEDRSLFFERAGVWVRPDAVWLLEPSVHSWSPSWSAEDDAKERVCDRDACTRVLARTGCYAPECPANGILLFTERPLGMREPWPTEPAAWERLVAEIAGDPALGVLIGGPQSFPRRPPPRPETFGWASWRFTRGIELAASADYGRTFDGEGFAGPGFRAGWHYDEPVQDTTTQGKIFEPLVGDGWGVDLRFAALRALDGTASGTGLRAGVALSATNAIGLTTSESRVRVGTLLGLVLPEVGVVRLPGESVRFATTNALPISLLLTRRLALEVRPELSVLFGSGGPSGTLSLSLGLMWRTRESICPDPPGLPAVDASSCRGSTILARCGSGRPPC